MSSHSSVRRFQMTGCNITCTDASQRMLAIATHGEVAALLFHTPTQYGSNRFRQIFIDHWERWWDYRREKIPADQRAYVQKMVEKMMGCRNPQCGYARYPSAGFVRSAMRNG